ncbi:MAG: ATP-binding cassette domain-containing protein, partial [Lachnospiraceae bacterium]
MNPLLVCQGLSKKYNNHYALSNVNLSLERGQIIGLLGPNGSGKTTLIKLINGLLTPTDGFISIGNLIPGVETKKIIAYLPERSYLNHWMKVKDLISYFDDFYDDFSKERAYDMLNHLHIDKTARLRTLSKG